MVFHSQIDGQTERVNQELKQCLRIFIDHRQEQWSDWLETAKFAYNDKVHLSMKTSPFKVNYRQNSRMGFEMKKKRRYKGVEKFVIKIKEIQEKTKVALEKAQKEIKKYTDRKRAEVNKYKVEDLVIFSIKNLKYQIIRKRTNKLIEKFVGSYKIKKIVLTNAVELKLPNMIKIHPVVNVSRIHKYVGQVEGQRRKQLASVIIEREEKQKVKKILNK